MSIFLEDLKAKALAATPGEWTLRDRGVICGGPVTEYFRGKGQPQIVMCCGGEQIGHEQKTANEHFIVAARPEVVLDLLERLENSDSERDALKAELEKAKRALLSAGYTLLEGAQEWKPPIGPSSSPLLDLIDSLRAELEAARKQEPVAGVVFDRRGDILEIQIFNQNSLIEDKSYIEHVAETYGEKVTTLYASQVPAQSEALEVLSSAINTLKTVADNCEWSHSDFPVIARAEKLLKGPPCDTE